MHWKVSQKHLRFVQRGRILLRCGSAFALSLPSLGVSSLDLGRLFIQAALFLGESFRGARSANLRCAIAHRGISRFRVWSFGPSRNDEKSISPHSPIFQSGAPQPSFFARLPASRGADKIHQVQKMMIPAMFRRQPADVGADIGRGNREQQQPAAFGEKFHMEKRLQQRKHHVTRFRGSARML